MMIHMIMRKKQYELYNVDYSYYNITYEGRRLRHAALLRQAARQAAAGQA